VEKTPGSVISETEGRTIQAVKPECGLDTCILASRQNEERWFDMECPLCQGHTRRFGQNRNGSQRYRCDACRRTFTDKATRPTDRRRLAPATVILCLRMLLEGNSIRSVERLTGVHRDTIITAMVEAGKKCKTFMESVIERIPVADVQVDEIWGFVGCKEKTRQRKNKGEEFGDAYCFTAIERETKMIVAWHLGKRSTPDTFAFADKLKKATSGRFQLTTDGFPSYKAAIPATFPSRVDYATLVKMYGKPPDEGRYSPPQVVDTVITPQLGNPDPERICTSHVERHNRTIRMAIRRMTRLTDAHSKKWENHDAALALFFAYYNFCRVHMTLKTTPAVATGWAFRPWSLQELLNQANGCG
jgi:transposase-like protein/IS1 family transposase